MKTKNDLDIFRTPSCMSVELYTKRLRLRQVEIEDYEAIKRIKMEPIVQKTQLCAHSPWLLFACADRRESRYGSPSSGEVKHSFQNRYIRSWSV